MFEKTVTTETHTADSLIRSCVESISNTYENKTPPEKQRFIKTGFEDIDYHMLGLQLGSLIILSGDVAAGKTNLMLNFAQHIAVENKTPVGIISLRHDAEDLMMRIISSVCKVYISSLYNGMLLKEDWEAMMCKLRSIKDAPLSMRDSPFVDADELLQRVESLVKEKECKIVFIDDFPFHYCHPDRPNKESERFVFSLKQLARKLNVAIVLTAGVSYQVAKRQNPRPKLSDFSVHGDIVSAADMVMCLYTERLYKPDSEHKDISELIILKGISRKILLRNELNPYCRFRDFASF